MRSAKYAGLLALSYASFAVAYIVLSGRIAAALASSVEELSRVELIKGVIYVVITSLMVFFGARTLLRRIEEHSEELVRRRHVLLASERRIFAGMLASSIAHDANNVLVGVLSDLEDVRAGGRDDITVRRLELAVRRLVGLNDRLLTAGRQEVDGERKSLDVVELVEDSIEILRGHKQLRTCLLRFVGEGPLTLQAHPVLLHQIVTNLVMNAAEAIDGKGTVEVRVSRESEGARIEVHDSGPGVPKSRREGLFEALESTKHDGSGLGLFSVKACAEAHGGSAQVDDSPLGGACFRVFLSTRPPAPSNEGARSTAPLHAS